MESFESREQRIETPQLSTYGLEQIANSLENTLEWNEIRKKIEAKIRAKEELTRDDGTNERSDWKRLGMFLINERFIESKMCRSLRENGVDIYEDETVIELHIPPQDTSIGEVQNSLARLCEYLEAIQREDRAPVHIYGISYLAKFAKRYGFEVVNLPNYVQENSGAAHLLSTYRNSSDEKKQKIAEKYETKDIQICYCSVDDFIDQISRDEQYLLRLRRYHTKRQLAELLG